MFRSFELRNCARLLSPRTPAVLAPDDPLLRLYETSSGTVAHYAYDGLNALAEYDGSGALQRRWVYDPTTGQPVVWYEGTALGTAARRFLSADERGSIISVSDSNGASLGINSYDEYGIPAATNVGRYGYIGQAWLGAAKLWYLNARMYAPQVGGTFLQPDPIGYAGGINIYAYTGGDPVNYVDPLGLKWVFVSICGPAHTDGGIAVPGSYVCSNGTWRWIDDWDSPPRIDLSILPIPGWSGSPAPFGVPGLPEVGGSVGGPVVANPLPPPPPGPANPAYCSSLGYRVGDFIDSKVGSGVKFAGTGIVAAGGAVALSTAITGVGAGAGGAIAALGGLVYAGGTAVSTIGNGMKWLSGQAPGPTIVGLFSIPTMTLGPVSQIAADQTVSYIGGKVVRNPCD